MHQEEIDKAYIEQIIEFFSNYISGSAFGNVSKIGSTYHYSFNTKMSNSTLYAEFLTSLKKDLTDNTPSHQYVIGEGFLPHYLEEALHHPKISFEQLNRTFSLIDNRSCATNKMLSVLIKKTSKKDNESIDKVIQFMSRSVDYLNIYNDDYYHGINQATMNFTEFGQYCFLATQAMKKFSNHTTQIEQAMVENVKHSRYLDDQIIAKIYGHYFGSANVERFLEKTDYSSEESLFQTSNMAPIITFEVNAKIFMIKFSGHMLDFDLHALNDAIEEEHLDFPKIYLVNKEAGKYILGVESCYDNAIELAQQALPLFLKLKDTMPTADILLKAKMEYQLQNGSKKKMKI